MWDLMELLVHLERSPVTCVGPGMASVCEESGWVVTVHPSLFRGDMERVVRVTPYFSPFWG